MEFRINIVACRLVGLKVPWNIEAEEAPGVEYRWLRPV